MIKVLWIDDEYEKQDGMIDSAYQNHNITLIPFKTSKAGMESLNSDINAYSGVILDAKVFDESENEVAKLTGLVNSVYRLKELSSKRFIPYVVFTGQKDLSSDKTFDDMLPGINIFKKGLETDKMFDYLLNEIEKLEETKLIKDYQPAFEACSIIGSENKQILIQILLGIRRPLEKFDDYLYFTQIRILLEGIFRESNKIGLLHDKCINEGKVNLTESWRFLAGKDSKHLDVKCAVTHFPKIISDSVIDIINITGAASHTSDPVFKSNINIEEYRKLIKTPYLLYSLTFLLMDILVWFKIYKSQYPDVFENKKHWLPDSKTKHEEGWISGEVIRIAEKGNGIFKPTNGGLTLSIKPDWVKEFNLTVNQHINIRTKSEEDKTHIIEIKI